MIGSEVKLLPVDRKRRRELLKDGRFRSAIREIRSSGGEPVYTNGAGELYGTVIRENMDELYTVQTARGNCLVLRSEMVLLAGISDTVKIGKVDSARREIFLNEFFLEGEVSGLARKPGFRFRDPSGKYGCVLYSVEDRNRFIYIVNVDKSPQLVFDWEIEKIEKYIKGAGLSKLIEWI